MEHPVPDRHAVVVHLVETASPSAQAVLSAALQLFGPQDPVDVVLVLPGVDVPQEEHGALVSGLVVALVPDPARLPEVLLEGADAAAARGPLAEVRASGDPVADARAVVLLGAAAQQLWDAEQPAPPPVSPSDAATAALLLEVEDRIARLTAERDRARALERVARRDVHRAGGRPRVVLLFQHRAYWGAVATLWEALAQRPEVEVHVVALDSAADGRGESTAAFLREQGVVPQDEAWLVERLDDVDALVLLDPYDETRPEALRVPALAARGVRLVAVPYGGNAIGGAFMDALLWDLPLQRTAWRSVLGSLVQARLAAQHCRAGSDGVRVLGAPKADRVVRAVRSGTLTPGAQALRDRAAGRPLVLWNPHFRVGPGGWSTFDRYLEPLLARAAVDPSTVLLVRPHFRLFPDLRALGRPHLERRLREAVGETVWLDETPDCLDALTACDAMLSDLSSLATELLPSGKPVLYLHREDGPGPNEEGAHFAAMYRADAFDDVAAFLDLVARGEDPQREARLEVVRRDLALADGAAGERIADALVADLLAELGA